MTDKPDDWDAWDEEPRCSDCKGKGWIFLLTSYEECKPCQGTGVDLHAAGYVTRPDDSHDTED